MRVCICLRVLYHSYQSTFRCHATAVQLVAACVINTIVFEQTVELAVSFTGTCRRRERVRVSQRGDVRDYIKIVVFLTRMSISDASCQFGNQGMTLLRTVILFNS